MVLIMLAFFIALLGVLFAGGKTRRKSRGRWIGYALYAVAAVVALVGLLG